MRSYLPHLFIVGLTVLFAGCATSVDMDSMNRRIDDNAARLAAIEKAQKQEDRKSETQRDEKLLALQKEVEDLRKDFADSSWNVDNLAERVESLSAFMKEVEQFMVQFRKKGNEIDKALEAMTNRLEADVRSLAEKLRKMLEEGSQQ